MITPSCNMMNRRYLRINRSYNMITLSCNTMNSRYLRINRSYNMATRSFCILSRNYLLCMLGLIIVCILGVVINRTACCCLSNEFSLTGLKRSSGEMIRNYNFSISIFIFHSAALTTEMQLYDQIELIVWILFLSFRYKLELNFLPSIPYY